MKRRSLLATAGAAVLARPAIAQPAGSKSELLSVYPAWFDGEKSFYHLSKKVPPKGESLIYCLEPRDTPALSIASCSTPSRAGVSGTGSDFGRYDKFPRLSLLQAERITADDEVGARDILGRCDDKSFPTWMGRASA